MSLMKELKAEITRLARREIRKELDSVKRVNAAQRGLIANLRRDVTELQKETGRLKRELAKALPAAQETEAAETKFWITGKGVVSLRKRLGLTQAELAQLAGVSVQSVVNWEKVAGKIPFRQEKTAVRMQQVRGMNMKEAWAELE